MTRKTPKNVGTNVDGENVDQFEEEGDDSPVFDSENAHPSDSNSIPQNIQENDQEEIHDDPESSYGKEFEDDDFATDFEQSNIAKRLRSHGDDLLQIPAAEYQYLKQCRENFGKAIAAAKKKADDINKLREQLRIVEERAELQAHEAAQNKILQEQALKKALGVGKEAPKRKNVPQSTKSTIKFSMPPSTHSYTPHPSASSTRTSQELSTPSVEKRVKNLPYKAHEIVEPEIDDKVIVTHAQYQLIDEAAQANQFVKFMGEVWRARDILPNIIIEVESEPEDIVDIDQLTAPKPKGAFRKPRRPKEIDARKASTKQQPVFELPSKPDIIWPLTNLTITQAARKQSWSDSSQKSSVASDGARKRKDSESSKTSKGSNKGKESPPDSRSSSSDNEGFSDYEKLRKKVNWNRTLMVLGPDFYSDTYSKSPDYAKELDSFPSWDLMSPKETRSPIGFVRQAKEVITRKFGQRERQIEALLFILRKSEYTVIEANYISMNIRDFNSFNRAASYILEQKWSEAEQRKWRRIFQDLTYSAEAPLRTFILRWWNLMSDNEHGMEIGKPRIIGRIFDKLPGKLRKDAGIRPTTLEQLEMIVRDYETEYCDREDEFRKPDRSGGSGKKTESNKSPPRQNRYQKFERKSENTKNPSKPTPKNKTEEVAAVEHESSMESQDHSSREDSEASDTPSKERVNPAVDETKSVDRENPKDASRVEKRGKKNRKFTKPSSTNENLPSTK